MAKLRHIALAVPDPEKAAKFYSEVFEMKIVEPTESPLASGYYLTDGTICLALLNYKTDEAAGKERGRTGWARIISASGSTIWTRSARRSSRTAARSFWTSRMTRRASTMK